MASPYPVGFGAARLVKRKGRIKFCPHITAPPLPHAPRHPSAGHEVDSSPAAQPFSSPLTPTHHNLPHYYFALHEGWCIFACIGMQVGQRCQSNIQYCEAAQPPFHAIPIHSPFVLLQAQPHHRHITEPNLPSHALCAITAYTSTRTKRKQD